MKFAQRALIDRAFVLLTAVVAMSTAVLPEVTGYGTQLFQVVVLGAYAILAMLISDQYADGNNAVVWVIALFTNVLAFWLIAAPLWALTRRRHQTIGVTVLVMSTVFYLAMLFVLFPATDGP